MWQDPIVEEIQNRREKHAAQFHFDVKAIVEALEEQNSDREVVSYAEIPQWKIEGVSTKTRFRDGTVCWSLPPYFTDRWVTLDGERQHAVRRAGRAGSDSLAFRGRSRCVRQRH